ncbi:cobalt-precorrin-6B (C15)-methyltransferase [Gammaproteobacteria bacterium]|nr:class I SAM-dependent methyltransferase [Gammaproteobacteria bacterium]QOJ32258.1 MAG: class I SAM-dependent methyltransferase [Gammaproteobacteria bacterium]CAG0941527.1 cobalt-precorrin-6B (C15)-methyltransferase [Gammaproteobacteria bacterium]
MGEQSRKVFDRLYGKAKRPEDLPWHRAQPPALLVEALDARAAPGLALDVGCGAGTYSVYMAKRGYRVTGVDFMPQAVSLLTQQAARESLDITAVRADVTTWAAPSPFDVVLDVGCLHSLGAAQRAAYKARLLQWLAPGGDFILVHCASRGWWDRWPVGPNRIARDTIERLLAPELVLRAYQPELLGGMPLFMGRSALVGRYWFRREH